MAVFSHGDWQVSYGLRGRGPDFLFLHGLAADRRQAEAALDRLDGYRIVSVDMPGHGESRLSKQGQSTEKERSVGFDTYAAVAVALLNHLDIDKAIVGGISMGAGIALNLALAQPDRVRALVLVRPAWLDRPGRPHLSILEEIGDWLGQHGGEEADKRLRAHALYQSIEAENPKCAASIHGAITRPQAVEAATVLRQLVADRPFKRIEALRHLSMPALVVANNADPLHPSLIAREIQGALTQAEYFHAPPRYLAPSEHHQAVLERISEFLSHALQEHVPSENA